MEVVHECSLYFFSTDDPAILRKKTLHIAKCFWKLSTSKSMDLTLLFRKRRLDKMTEHALKLMLCGLSEFSFSMHVMII